MGEACGYDFLHAEHRAVQSVWKQGNSSSRALGDSGCAACTYHNRLRRKKIVEITEISLGHSTLVQLKDRKQSELTCAAED